MNANTPLLHGLTRGASKALLVAGLACALAQPALADLTHRYSFTSDATDSIGGANGTVMGLVTFAGGEAVFPATVPSGDGSDYIDLPPGLISNYTAVTFEFWANPGAMGVWSQIYGFGNQTAGLGANMLMFCPKSGPDDYRMSYAQADPGYTDEHITTGGGYLDGLGPLSITCVYDPPNNRMSLYKNGLLISTLSPVTATNSAKQFSLTNVYNVHSWLGRSLYNGDAAYNGTLNELRIYNAALNPLQVAINYSAGPDEVVTNYTPTSAGWNVPTALIVGERYDTTATLSYLYNNSTKSGSATMVSLSDPVYSSSNTNVVDITASGRLLAMAPGTATVTAVYLGQTFNQTVTVSAAPKLLHRYSFTADASDSVTAGKADGTLMGGATITGGAVLLSGVGSSGSAGDYVDLPNDLFTNVTSVTVETWFTDNGSAGWARVWDFGNSVGGEDTATGGGDNFFLSQPSGAGPMRGLMNIGSGEQQVNTSRLPVGQKSYVVYVIDPAHRTASLYVNGALKDQNISATLVPADLGSTRNDWIGRSQYNDPYFNGAIDELRIWQGAFSATQVAINAASGPDTVGPTDPGALQAIHLTVAPNMIKGGIQQAAVTADFALISGVNAASLGVVYTSGNTNVLTVNANGSINAVGIGTTTVTVSLQGKTDVKSITVIVKPTVLAHRWSFNETAGTSAADSVGTATGALVGGATWNNGAVSLNGVDAYVDFPSNLLNGFDAVTFEAWATVNSATVNSTDARLYAFGSAPTANELGMIVRTGGGNTSLRFYGGGVSLITAQGGNLGLDQQLHIVAVYNPPQGTVDMFVNGSWWNSATNIGFSLATITNTVSRLGANILGTAFTAADVNEFRIYNGALDLLGIRANQAAGPGTTNGSLATATSLSLRANPGMVAGSQTVPHVQASFSSAANVDLTDTRVVTFTSTDPAVVAITPDGLVQAVGPGSATLTAAYGGQNASQTITVYPKQTMLVNRYSFTNDATDSVGVQDGVLWGTAAIVNGSVATYGDATLRNSFVELPRRLVSSYDAVTLECWMTLGTIGTWARIYDFGSQTVDGNGLTYIFLTRTGTPSTRTVLKDTGAEAVYDTTGALLDAFTGQMVVVYDPASNTQLLYTNGVLVGSGSLNGKVMAGVNDLHCWLGKSLYAGDSGLAGLIDEFRIYAGVLTPAQIAASYTSGPDKVALAPPVAAGPKLTAAISGGNLVITWPASGTGFTLKTSTVLGPAASWSTVSQPQVVVGANIQVTIPLATGGFYRLVK